MNLKNEIIRILKQKRNDGTMSPDDIYNLIIEDVEIKNYMSSELKISTFEDFHEYVKGNKISKVIFDYILYEDFSERY